MSRITTMSEAETALNGVNISIKDMAGNVRPVSDILSQLAGQWGNLSDEQRQNLGVTLAGRYQLSRFLALMNNFSISQEATESSLNSTNSSMEEQAKFADSLQGRINRLDTAWNKLTLSTGDAFLTDGLISAVEILGDIANISSAVIDKVGVLSGVFGTAGIAVFAFSANLRTLTTASLFGTQAVSQQALATAGLTTSMRAGTIATIGLTGALRGLLSASIIGGIFVALGFAIEKLISAYANAKREQEEFEESQQKNVEALTKNKEKTEELIEQYNKLSEQKKNGAWDTENEKEYLRVQSEIASVYPALIDHIDSTGQAHIRTSEEIQKEIDLTNKLIEAKKEELKVKAQDEIQKEIDKQKELREELEDLKKQRDNFKDYKGSMGANDQELEKRIKSVETQMVSTEIKISSASQKINDQILKVSDAYNKLEVSPAIQKSVDSLVNSMDFSDMDASEIEGVSIKVAELTDNLQKAYESGNENSYQKALNDFNTFMESVGATDVSLDELDMSYENVEKQTTALASATYDGTEAMDDMGESIDGVSESTDQLLKSYEDAVDNISELNGVINDLSEGHGASADTIGLLMEKYPHLLQYVGDETKLREEITKIIEQEADVAKRAMLEKLKTNETFYNNTLKGNGQLVNILKNTYGIDLENYKNLAQAKQEVDNKLRLELSKAWNDFVDSTGRAMSVSVDGRAPLAVELGYGTNKFKNNEFYKAYTEVREVYADFNNIGLEQIDILAGNSIEMEGLSEKTSKSAKATEYSTYVTDKFKNSMEYLNLAMEKYQAIQAKFPKHSKEYQKALNDELYLLNKKKDLLEDQAKSLNKQISSGKILQTGLITSSSAPVSTASYSTTSGGSNAEKIWNFFKSKGFSDSIAAGIMGNLQLESGLNPNALNASSGAFGLAQWLGGRKTALKSYASSVGTSISDINTQLNFLWKELNGSENRTMKYLQANQNASASTIAAAFDRLFERSEGTHIPHRQKYANDFLNKFSGTSGSVTASSSTSDASKEAAQNLSDIDNAKSDLLQLKQEAINVQQQIDQINLAIVESGMAYYDNIISGVDRYLERSEKYLAKYSSTSKEYRDELDKQSAKLAYKQDLMEKEADYIRKQMKSEKLSLAVKDQLQAKLSELSIGWWDVNEAMQAVEKSIVDSKLQQFTDLIEGANNSIEKSRVLMELHTKGSDRYNKEQKNIIKTMEYQQTLYHKEAEYIREQLKNEKLSVEQKKELEKQLSALSLAWWGLENQILDYNQQIADEAIDIIKKSYEQKRDYEIKLKDEQIKNAEEAHERKMELLDEEMDRYEEAVNHQLDLMKRQQDQDSFNKDVTKLQEEEAKIRSEIDTLSLDDSVESQLKRKELQEQLADIKEQIEDRQYDRSYQLREQNLQDELDSYQKDIEAKKKAEDEKFEAIKKQLDRERLAIEQHYDQLINDEAYYASLRQDIVNGNVDSMNSKLKEFLSEFKNYNSQTISELELSWQSLQNLINNIINLQGQLGNVSAPNTGGIGSGAGGSSQKQSDWNKYLSNKKAYDNSDIAKRKQLHQENEELRSRWGFPDGSYDALKNLKAYHKGGLVGDKGSRLGELANKLFNKKPNEQIIKSLQGELQIPPQNIPNIFTNMKALITPKANNGGVIQIDNLISIGNVTKDANLDIDKLTNQAMDKLVSKMKPYGFRLN